MPKRFLFHNVRGVENGFACGFRFRHHGYLAWLGYGKPVWWKPRLLGKGDDGARLGFGFGWLLLCFQVKIVELEIPVTEDITES